jgi:long-chain acyl-CoA synthetase
VRADAPPKRTIGALWRRAVADERSFPAYLVEADSGWREMDWEEAERRVDELANGLLALGIRKGDSVGLLGRTRVEWGLLDFALALVGGVTAPLYADSSAGEWAYALDLVGAVAVFADESLRGAVEEAVGGDPRMRHLLSLDELDDLAARGREYAADHPDALAEAESAVAEDDLYTFIYTSGTTGPPKACTILHRNYFEMAATVDRVEELTVRGDLLLLYLPLAHNFGRLLHLLGAYEGYTIAFLRDALRTPEALTEVRPTVLPSVPRLYEKVHTRIQAQFDEARGMRRRLIDWALAVGNEASPYKRRGRSLPMGLTARHALAKRLLYSRVKKRLGGRLRLAVSGGAPLAPEIGEFFLALDILILEGYGLSECTTACAVNRPGRVKFGTVGPPLPGFEVRIAEDGEILIRSETVFAGYYGDEDATRAVLDADGWLHSGDVGAIDDEGFLRVTDRKKDIIVTAGGKNVAPQNLENALKSTKLISQALVIGDRRPYVSALVTLDAEQSDGLSEAEVREAVQAIVDSVNEGRARYEQIKRFTTLPREFSAAEGEVTPTLKLRRRVCEEHFAAEIEKLYS